MGVVKDLADNVFRDFQLSNVPASGVNKPQKQGVRALFSLIDALTLGAQAGGALTFVTRAEANSNLNYAPFTMAWVVLDPTPSNNGVYAKSGSAGSGSWVKQLELPYSFYRATNAGAGNPNAIIATNVNPLVSPGALIVF
ncbi:MAG: hypothetical protein EON54_16530, partial [Alcaligenaceae bacterium]